MRVDVVRVADRHLLLALVLVEQAEILLLLAVKVKAKDRLAIVVVEKDAKVALLVAVVDTANVDDVPQDRLDDVVPLQLLLGGDDLRVLVLLALRLHKLRGHLRLVGDARRRRPERALELVAESVGDELAERLAGELGELLLERGRQPRDPDPARTELHELVARGDKLLAEEPLDLPHILQLVRRGEHRVDIEGSLRELLQLGDQGLGEVRHLEHQERLRVHLVRRLKVGEESVLDPVGEHCHAAVGAGEVAEELAGVLGVEVRAVVLALEEHYRLAVLQDRVVDLLALLGADVGDQLGRDLHRVEHVVAECGDEGHDEGVLRGLLGADGVSRLLDTGGDGADVVDQIWHGCGTVHQHTAVGTRLSSG